MLSTLPGSWFLADSGIPVRLDCIQLVSTYESALVPRPFAHNLGGELACGGPGSGGGDPDPWRAEGARRDVGFLVGRGGFFRGFAVGGSESAGAQLWRPPGCGGSQRRQGDATARLSAEPEGDVASGLAQHCDGSGWAVAAFGCAALGGIRRARSSRPKSVGERSRPEPGRRRHQPAFFSVSDSRNVAQKI